jgi:hypothetical protein
MPGVNLNLSLPTLSDSQTVVITKIATALTAIQNDLTPKIIPAEININSAIDMAGNSITNLAKAQFIANTSIVPGTIYYDGVNWFAVTSVGTVQFTANGAVNVSTTGGIGGDYGPSAALVFYDNSLQRYRFFGAGASSIVDLEARKLVLDGSLASVTFGVNAAVASNKTFNYLSTPSSGVGLLAFDASTNSMVDGATVPITSSPTFSNAVTFNAGVTINGALSVPTTATIGTVTATNVNTTNLAVSAGATVTNDVLIGGNYRHSAQFSAEIPFTNGESPSAGQLTNTSRAGLVSFSGTGWNPPPFNSIGLRAGDIIQNLVFRVNKTTTGNTVVTLTRRPIGGVDTTVQTFTFTTITSGDLLCTVSSPVAIAARERWFMSMTVPSGADSVSGATVNWTA